MVLQHAPFFAQVSPQPQIVRQHHRDVLAAIKARQPDKAARAVNDYLHKAQEMLLALFPRSSNDSSGKDGK